MARKSSHIPRSTLFVGLLTASTIVYLLPQSITNNLNFFYSSLFGKVLDVGRSGPVEGFSASPSSGEYVSREEYNKLLAHNDNLRAALMTEHEKVEKLERIRSELPKPGPVIRLADVINSSAIGARHELLINKGAKNGVEKGQYVLGNNCLIGTISETADYTAKVRLVTDGNHRIEIRLWRQGRRGVIPGQLTGTGNNVAKIPLISREYDVAEGDAVYAAARPGYLDTPIVTGRVVKVEPDDENPLLLDISVQPIYELGDIDSVGVILREEE